MLMSIRAFNEAARAFVLWTALKADVSHRSDNAAERQAADDHLGLMTPVVKGVLTDIGFDNAVKAQQMFGGHGYIAEWGMEQFVRDARIAMIYEGANGIQAMDLVGRKLGKDGGRAVMAFFNEVTGFPEGERGRREPRRLAEAGRDRARPSAAGDDVVHAERAREARQCRRRRHRLHAPVRPRRARLYVGEDRQGGAGEAEGRRRRRGRAHGSEARDGRFFMERMLPETAAQLARITAGADSVMALPAEAF